MYLCTTWNVAIGKLYGHPAQTHCRYLIHVRQQNHVDHILISVDLLNLFLTILGVKIFSSLTLLRYVLKVLAPHQVALFQRY